MLLYFVKSKNDTKCKNFVDLLCCVVLCLNYYYIRLKYVGSV